MRRKLLLPSLKLEFGCYSAFFPDYQASIISENAAMLSKMTQSVIFPYIAEKNRSHFKEPITYSSYIVDSILRDHLH